MSQRVLVFSSEDALLAALSSDLLPPQVQARKVDFWTGDDGTIFVRPVRRLARDVLQRLRSAGVGQSDMAAPATALRARVWPRIIPPRPLGDDDVDLAGQTVLLSIDANAARTLIDVAAELLRLGCDRCAYQFLDTEADTRAGGATRSGTARALLRVFDPPYYTVAGASEPDAAYRAFIPVRSGDARTWIEIGYWHPLASAFVPPTGHLGIISGAGDWHEVPDGPWHDIFDIVDITPPNTAPALIPIEPPRRLAIELRLATATRTEAPSLWVVGGTQASDGAGFGSALDNTSGDQADAIDQVDSLVGSLPDDVIGRLLFAVVGEPRDPVVVLRARHGRAGPPSLDVPGVAMVPLLGLSNLYLPHQAMLEPPLRRDTVRTLLAPEEDLVYWLQPVDERGFRVECTPDRGFSPLSDWIDYLIHRNAQALEPWVRSVTFEFDSFQSIGTEWAAEPPRAAKAPGADKPHSKTPTPEDETPSTVPYAALEAATEMLAVESQLTEAPAEPYVPTPRPTRELSELEAELAELERAFLDSETATDSQERTGMWLAMARLLSVLTRDRDAALCYVRAVWESSGPAAAAVVKDWARAERDGLGVSDPAALLWLPVKAGNPVTESDPRPSIRRHPVRQACAQAR